MMARFLNGCAIVGATLMILAMTVPALASPALISIAVIGGFVNSTYGIFD